METLASQLVGLQRELAALRKEVAVERAKPKQSRTKQWMDDEKLKKFTQNTSPKLYVIACF